jgi:hypothetical protein
VEDVDATSVSLSWTKPKNDGGNKVQGYQVEYKEKNSSISGSRLTRRCWLAIPSSLVSTAIAIVSNWVSLLRVLWHTCVNKSFGISMAMCCIVDGLDTNKEYEFRVVAKNAAGLGEPSNPTAPVLVKPKASRNLTFRQLIKNVEILLGRDLIISVLAQHVMSIV